MSAFVAQPGMVINAHVRVTRAAVMQVPAYAKKASQPQDRSWIARLAAWADGHPGQREDLLALRGW